MTQKIRYFGRRSDGHMIFLSLAPQEALEKGKSFKINGYKMNLSESDELCFRMHQHCPHLDVKMNGHHEFTIKELYNMCPEILIDLLELNGGIEFIAHILIGCEELYNQQKIVKQWQENP
jgi:hypothetical protein